MLCHCFPTFVDMYFCFCACGLIMLHKCALLLLVGLKCYYAMQILFSTNFCGHVAAGIFAIAVATGTFLLHTCRVFTIIVVTCVMM